MHLALFDIDGTLMRSNHADSIFVQVMSRAFSVDRIETDWGRYPHASDSAITRTLLERHRGAATPEALATLHDAYVEALAQDRSIRPIDGAAAALEHLVARGWAVAIATGNWNAAGRFKLQAAQLPADRFPLAGATGIESREAIMQDGIDRACAAYEVSTFERVVYIGDASWDVQASRGMNMPLVGISDPVERLLEMGVSHVLPDYRDLPAFEDAVHNARAP